MIREREIRGIAGLPMLLLFLVVGGRCMHRTASSRARESGSLRAGCSVRRSRWC